MIKDRFKDNLYFNGFNCIDQPQKKYKFKNGYVASVIKTHESTTNLRELDLYELAILKDDELCYTTPLTNDTLKQLSIDAVNWFLKEIKELDDNEQTN